MTDRFFTTSTCDRCSTSLEGQARKMSWFTEDCLCVTCMGDEEKLREALETKGINVADMEGCGYMPKINNGEE